MDFARLWTSRNLLVTVWCLWCLHPAFVGRVQQLGAHAGPHSSGKSSTLLRHAVAVEALEDAEEDAFEQGDQVVLTAPPAMAGKHGTIVQRVNADAFAVRLESGSIFNIETENIKEAIPTIPIPIKAAGKNVLSQLKKGVGKMLKKSDASGELSRIAKLNLMHALLPRKGRDAERQTPAAPSTEPEEDVFAAGEEVILTAPPAMAGKKGTIVRRVEEGDAFAVRLASGSIFNIETENIKGSAKEDFLSKLVKGFETKSNDLKASVPVAKIPMPTKKHEAFRKGQHVILTAPPQMAGKQGTVLQREGDGYTVSLEGGSVLNMNAADIRDAGIKGLFSKLSKSVATKQAVKPSESPKVEKPEEEEDVFREGQKVVLTAPPAMAGKQGTIIQRVDDDAFAVRLESGSVFNIQTESIKETNAVQAAGEGLLSTGKGFLARGEGLLSTGKGFLARLKVAWTGLFKKSGAKQPLKKAPVATRAPATPETSKAATAPAVAVAQLDEEESDEFEEGQEVVLSAPPAMAGKQGTIVGPVQDVQGDAYAVRLQSGSVFNIQTENIQDAAGAGGAGGRGIGGFGRGGGGAGKPPSAGSAGEPWRNPGELGWIVKLLAGVLFVSWIVYFFKSRKVKLRMPRWQKVKLPRWRIDRKPISWNFSSGSSPLGALLILAALGFYMAMQKCLPGFMAWLQEHLTASKAVITEHVPLIASADADATEADGFTMLDAVLLVAAAVLAISWYIAGRSKSRKAAVRAAVMKNLSETSKKKVTIASEKASFIEASSARSYGPTGGRGNNPNEGDASRSTSPFQRERPLALLPLVGKPKIGQSTNSPDTNLLDGLWPMAATTDPEVENTIEVTFVVEMRSAPGDRLLVVGGHAGLGDWIPERSLVELRTHKDRYPIWVGKWHPRATSAEYEFKLVLVNTRGQYRWEEVLNRSVSVARSSGDQTLEIKFNRPGFQRVSIEELTSSLAGS